MKPLDSTFLAAFCGDNEGRYDLATPVWDPVSKCLLATNGAIFIAVPSPDSLPGQLGDKDVRFPRGALIDELSPRWHPDLRFAISLANLQAIVDYASKTGENAVQFGLRADANRVDGPVGELSCLIAFAVGAARGAVYTTHDSDFTTLLAGVPISLADPPEDQSDE